MSSHEPYATPAGVEAAIRAAAQEASRRDPSLTTNDRVRHEYFNRFLSRVFHEGSEAEWVLKGGTGMLARVPSARATLDIDLYVTGYTIGESLDDLRTRSEVDLDDHFRFVYSRHRAIVGGDAQPYTDAYRVEFDVYIGAQQKGNVRIDLATGAGLTADPTICVPASALDLPRLPSNPYRLYPVADQIADKVCATLQRYSDRPSSREKDLVDLVVLAATHDVDGRTLIIATEAEASRRRMALPHRFVVPSRWGAAYSSLARKVPYCHGFEAVDDAARFVAAFIDPVLDRAAAGRTWKFAHAAWRD